MTEITTNQATNGHRRATERLPFAPFDPDAKPSDEPLTATTDEPLTTSDTPLLDAEGGITCGNETGPEPVSPVEGMTVTVKPAPGRRWEALRDQDVPIPAALRDLGALKTALRRELRALRNAAILGAVALPKTIGLCTWWLIRGTGITVTDLVMWLLVRELHPDLSSTPATSDKAAVAMDHRRLMRQRIRRNIVVTAVGLLAATAGAAWWFFGTWPLWGLGAALVAFLVWRGKPVGKRVFLPTGSQKLLPRLTLDRIVSAFGVLGISGINASIKAGRTGDWWVTTPQAIKGGHLVEMHLPNGVESRSIIPFEQRLAGALGRPEDCVIVEPQPHMTPSHMRLYVYDTPRLEKVGAGPLVTARKASWFDPVAIGITRAGKVHRVHLQGGAWFIGGQPGSGKSSLAFVAAAHTALDPRARLMVAALKGGADFGAFEALCDRYICGAPETSRTVIPEASALLRWVLDEAGRRGDFLAKLSKKDHTTYAKVTPELAAKYPKQLGPITVILDEVHRLLDESDNPDAKATGELIAKVIKAVRFVAITLISVTQLAGGESVPPVITRAARVRGCLRVGDEVSWRQIFGNVGQGAFQSAGAGRLKPGQVILATESGDPVKIGVFDIAPHLDKVCARAVAVREALGVLGRDETPLPGVVDPAVLLRDLAVAIPTAAPVGGPADGDAAWLSALEVALTEKPDYRGRARGWLSTELRSRKVPTSQLNRRVPESETYPSGQRNERSVSLVDVRQALERLLGEE